MSTDDDDAKTEEKEEGSSGIVNSDIEDGYQTPTSEEHKIPAVVLSCPPPAPKKRKRLVYMMVTDLQKRLDRVDDENKVVIKDEDMDVLFQSLSAGESTPPPPMTKKRCVDDEHDIDF